ncbi:hypothetical protein CEXT_283161 [Caerostris extrusa]|uniref:Uncharacterized protein n=1 Tax=Caerostris extrusa TaxID=172846 RepID=A0AAV4UTW8_CAEEX|nr:hypothetical protein CEXT_283161 [Caerostris extrusa]
MLGFRFSNGQMNKRHFEVLLPTFADILYLLLRLRHGNKIDCQRTLWLSIFLRDKCCVCLNEQTTFGGATIDISAAVYSAVWLILLCRNNYDFYVIISLSFVLSTEQMLHLTF